MLPWSSAILVRGTPLRRCNPSMFWVTMNLTWRVKMIDFKKLHEILRCAVHHYLFCLNQLCQNHMGEGGFCLSFMIRCFLMRPKCMNPIFLHRPRTHSCLASVLSSPESTHLWVPYKRRMSEKFTFFQGVWPEVGYARGGGDARPGVDDHMPGGRHPVCQLAHLRCGRLHTRI